MNTVQQTLQPSISVVIPCFNYGRYVAGAIESALAQTYGNKEIIVVNDGSTDDSLQIIQRYADRVRIIDQPNQGSIAAYNRGFAASRGEIVIFLDADDLLAPEALASVAAVWSPSCAKVQYDVAIIDAEGRDLGRRFCNFTADYDVARVRESFRRTGTYRWPITVGNAYSRWFVEQIFPLNVEHGPDGTLNTLAPLYGEVITLPDPLGCYRVHGANMWTSDGSDHGRLPYRIQHRRREIQLMRRHAAERGISVPVDDVLDHELPFLNYRLMAWKLGLDYEGKAQDSPRALVWRALRLLGEERYPWKMSAAHALWFGALLAAPRAVAAPLVRLRFNRAELKQRARERLEALLAREGRAA